MEIAEPLLKLSDPCGLMRKKVLNLPPDAFGGREEEQKEQEDMVVVRGCLGRGCLVCHPAFIVAATLLKIFHLYFIIEINHPKKRIH